MKILLNLAIALISIGFTNSYAEENSEVTSEAVVDEVSEEAQKALADKLEKTRPRQLKIYDFNPVKNPNGYITLVEFNDLSCKECLLNAQEVYDAIKGDDFDGLKVIYKHVQNSPVHLANKQAFWGFLASDYNKFWEVREKFVKNDYKTEDEFIDEFLKLGITRKDLFSNIQHKGEAFYKQVDLDSQYASSIKGHTSPMFFIDGYKLDEDISLQEMIEYIKLKKQDWLERKKQLEDKYKVGKL